MEGFSVLLVHWVERLRQKHGIFSLKPNTLKKYRGFRDLVLASCLLVFRLQPGVHPQPGPSNSDTSPLW